MVFLGHHGLLSKREGGAGPEDRNDPARPVRDTVGSGTSASTPGTLSFEYRNSTHILSILGSGGNLHAFNVSGSCLGLINNGDALTYTGDYLLSTPITITSP